MEFREFSAKTVDEAITKASIELGISSDKLEIRTISEGSAGFLGLGSKPAVIQVRKKDGSFDDNAADANADMKEDKAAEKSAEEKSDAAEEDMTENNSDFSGKPVLKDDSEDSAGKEEDSQAKDEEPRRHHREIVTDRSDEEISVMKKAAEKFLTDMFKAMDLPVTIKMEYNSEEGSLDIDLSGDDMGILIGKRGQTLDSIQYLVSLVVNREIDNYVRIKVDTEDYRRRRKETLENLAKNIASKVRRTRRPVSLEAMNPYERRIIHSALQGNKYVETHSEGNEPYRHVVVTLKKNSDY